MRVGLERKAGSRYICGTATKEGRNRMESYLKLGEVERKAFRNVLQRDFELVRTFHGVGLFARVQKM